MPPSAAPTTQRNADSALIPEQYAGMNIEIREMRSYNVKTPKNIASRYTGDGPEKALRSSV